LFYIILFLYLLAIFNLKIMKYITHTPTLKDATIWFITLAIIVLIPVLSGYHLEHENFGLWITLFVILGFFIFNFIIRKSLLFKNYFTSRFNLLTSKVHFEKEFDISKELMFEKLVEVINNSKFKLVQADNKKFEILAITTITWKSWGENLYISFDKIGDDTIMKFCSVTLFQIYSWGKNEKNYDDLIQEIENSLTI
jgi:hypothetical protein